jgi:hypothetical protein
MTKRNKYNYLHGILIRSGIFFSVFVALLNPVIAQECTAPADAPRDIARPNPPPTPPEQQQQEQAPDAATTAQDGSSPQE